MNMHAEKTQENKTPSAVSVVLQNQRDGQSAFQFFDNRPYAIAQRKLQAMMNQSPQAQRLAQLQASTNVIQRYLDIQGGGVFDAGNEEQFRQQYSAEARREMLSVIQEEAGPRARFPSIEAALASPDVIMIGGAEHEYYAEFIESERTVVDGGAQRNAGDHASYAARPAAGFEDLHLSGLMNCVAIVVETRDARGVSGIAMAHFTTPRGIDAQSRQLTDHGNLVLNGFPHLVPGGEAHLRWNQGSPEERDDPSVKYLSGQSAANIVAFALHARGIRTLSIEPLEGGACRYRLNHDGTAGWAT